MDIERKFFTKLKFIVLQYISDACLDQFVDDISMHEHIADAIVIKIRGHIFGQEIVEHTFEYPADWWQAFKWQYFPEWLLKRYPVKYESVKMTVTYMIDPSINKIVPKQNNTTGIYIPRIDDA